MAYKTIENRIKTLTLSSDSQGTSHSSSLYSGNSDCYYSLSNVNPEEKDMLERLQKERLKCVLEQLQREREDLSFSRNCLFCRKHFIGNRSLLLNHLMEQHNFLIGSPDNIVFINELLDHLEQMLKDLQCFYCEKTFKDWMALKEHMRKKQHKRVNPNNKFYDKFYVINYLELGKTWTDVQNEDDDFSQEDSEDKEMDDMDCQDDSSSYVCLFCEHKLFDFDKILHHMKEDHSFDFKVLKQKHKLSFYSQIKFINYIRRKMFEQECMYCDEKFPFQNEVVDHMTETGHISLMPDSAKWDQTMYYFSTFENDNLLCALDVEDSECQEDHLVYPEETVIPTSPVLCDENFRRDIISSMV